MRTNTQNIREHKVFIVVSGYCAHATEELYNLWLDARHSITIHSAFQSRVTKTMMMTRVSSGFEICEKVLSSLPWRGRTRSVGLGPTGVKA